MTLDTTSRYRSDTSGQYALPKEKGEVTYYTHRVVEGDTVLNLAARSLGSDQRWWEIADINPQVKYPEDLEVGTLLRIPR